MASSKVASTTSAPNSDLPPYQLPFPIPPPPLLLPDPPAISTATTTITATMDDFLNNMYGDSSSSSSAGAIPARGVVANGMDEAWKEPEMTLEDFLTRTAVAVRDDEMRIPVVVPSVSSLPPPQPPPLPQCFGAAVNATSSMISGGFGVVPGVAVGNGQFQTALTPEGFGNGVDIGGGRAKRRAVDEAPVDKATQQKQRRMIKNRESAARSRERKQAYTVDLESMVSQLEEENARLRNEEAKETKERFKQLMQNIIPVTEKQKPPRPLRRVNSMVW